MGNLPDRQQNNKKKQKYIKCIAVAAVIVTAAAAIRLHDRGSGTAKPESLPSVRIGVTEGIPSVIVKEIEKNQGAQSIEYADMKTYSFQDC